MDALFDNICVVATDSPTLYLSNSFDSLKNAKYNYTEEIFIVTSKKTCNILHHGWSVCLTVEYINLLNYYQKDLVTSLVYSYGMMENYTRKRILISAWIA